MNILRIMLVNHFEKHFMRKKGLITKLVSILYVNLVFNLSIVSIWFLTFSVSHQFNLYCYLLDVKN